MNDKLPEMLGAGRITTSPNWRGVKNHSHDFAEMMVLFGGRLAVEIGGRVLRASTGDVLFYPPAAPHTECGEGRDTVDFVWFGFRRDGPVSAPFLTHDREGRIRVLVEWILKEQASHYERKQEVLNAILCALLAEFRRVAGGTEDSLVAAVRAYLIDGLSRRLTVTDIASHVHMSRAHFQRVYRKLAGRTPMAELRRLRLEFARDRIITTDLPLKRIADQVGFCDEYHLSRVFRKCLRVPPSYFRKR